MFQYPDGHIDKEYEPERDRCVALEGGLKESPQNNSA